VEDVTLRPITLIIELIRKSNVSCLGPYANWQKERQKEIIMTIHYVIGAKH
jgi:hypothetical protein